MSRQRDLDPARIPSAGTIPDSEIAPGRGSRSSQLHASSMPIASGLVQRKARDADGVTEGAHTAIDAASASSGMSLPAELRSRFESSLGTDLSSVRVHTGSRSTHAAAAIGANAYTVGQDIHFAAGQYDPSSSAGQHLIAHEVAHTVQQRGAHFGVQRKLAVSRSSDALELEADAAADQMLAGSAARVSSGGNQHAIMRDSAPTEQQMDQEADASAASATAELHEHPPAFATLNIDGGAAQARSIISEIQGYDANMNAGVSDGTPGCVTRDQYSANQQAVATLQTFVNANQDQSSTLGQFQTHAQRLMIDYRRIQGQVAGFNQSAQGGGAVTGDMHGGQIADTVIAGASGGTLADLQRAFRGANAGANPAVAAHFTAMERTRTDLERVSREVATKELLASSREASARAAHSALVSAVAAQSAQGLEGQIAGLRAAATAMKEKIDLAAGMVKSLVKLGGAAATGGAVGGMDVANEATSAGFSIAGYLAAHQYDEQIGQLNAQLLPIAAQRDANAIVAARDHALAEKRAWEAAGQEYVDAIANQQRLRAELNTHLRDLGQAADRTAGGNSFTIVAQLLSDCEQFLAQAQTTIAVGENEEHRAGETTGAAAGVNAPQADGTRQPLVYFRPYQFWTRGAIRWGCTQVTAYLNRETRDSANQTVHQTLAELRQYQADVQQCTVRLRQVFSA